MGRRLLPARRAPRSRRSPRFAGTLRGYLPTNVTATEPVTGADPSATVRPSSFRLDAGGAPGRSTRPRSWSTSTGSTAAIDGMAARMAERGRRAAAARQDPQEPRGRAPAGRGRGRRADGRDDRRGRGLRGWPVSTTCSSPTRSCLAGRRPGGCGRWRTACRLTVGFDSVDGARAIADGARGDAVGRVGVLVEVDSGGHRTGVRPGGRSRAGRRRRSGWVSSVVGVFTHGGHGYAGPDARAGAADDEVEALAEAAAGLTAIGIEPRVVSAGSTPTAVGSARGGVTEERPGTYVYGDRDPGRAGFDRAGRGRGARGGDRGQRRSGRAPGGRRCRGEDPEQGRGRVRGRARGGPGAGRGDDLAGERLPRGHRAGSRTFRCRRSGGS